jgi:hypothetical protein
MEVSDGHMRNSEPSEKQRRKIQWEYKIQEINLSRTGADNTPQVLDVLSFMLGPT